MTSFTQAFRRNVTIPAALSAMLYSEEIQGDNTLAHKTQVMIENIRSDLEMLGLVDSRFNRFVTEADALDKFISMARNLLKHDLNLLPDEAVLQLVEGHQKRKFQTIEDARNRVDMVQRAFAIAPAILRGMAAS